MEKYTVRRNVNCSSPSMGEIQTIFFLCIFPNFSQWLYITLVIEEKKVKLVFEMLPPNHST